MPKPTSTFTPLYLRLKQDLSRKIRIGEYVTHQQLPTTLELMRIHGVSDGTVKRTMRELVQEGLVYTVNGQGSYVADLRQGKAAVPYRQADRPVIAIAYGRRPNEVIGNLFYSAMLQGIEEELGKHGMGLELINLKNIPFQDMIAARRRGAFSAVVLITALRQEEVAELAASGPATLSLLVEYAPVDGLYCLVTDELAGARMAGQHLLDCACRTPGAIVVPQRSSYINLRWQGFRQALEERGVAYDEGLVEPADWSMEGGYLAMRQLLQRRPEVDGVFAMNDAMAIGAIGAAFESGRSIPQDLKIIGYDDIEFARFFRPSLSTMRVARDEIGRRAVSVLLQRLEQPGCEFHIERIAPKLVVRASTAAAEVPGPDAQHRGKPESNGATEQNRPRLVPA